MVLGKNCFIRAKVFVFGQSGCTPAEVVLFGQKCEVVVLGQSGCVRTK